MSVQCEVCVKAITVASDRVFCFGGCGQIVHAKCADLTTAGVTALRENVAIKYVCYDCRKRQTCINSVMNKCVEMLQKLDDAMKHMEFMFVESEEKIVAKLAEKTEQKCKNVMEEFIRKNSKDLKIGEKKIVDTITCEIQKNVKNLEKSVERINVVKESNGSVFGVSNDSEPNFAEIVGGKQPGRSGSILRSGRVLQKPEFEITPSTGTSVGDLREAPGSECVSLLSENKKKSMNKKSPMKTNIANTVRIKPKIVQTNQDTKKEVRSKIDHSSGIKSVRNAKNGAILVECKSNSEADLLIKQANAKFSDNYEIFIEQAKKPKIKIIGMDEEYDDKDLKEIVMEQNEINEIKHFKIVKVIKASGRKFNSISVICEIDSDTFQKVMRWGKLNIEWEVCRVIEHVNILRCYKCCAYGHRSNDCTSKKFCVRCSGEHDVKDCDSEYEKCINCVTLKSERKLTINVDHAAWSTDCPVYKRNLKVSKQFIDYGK